MMTMGYHYTHFGSDSNRAVQEGNYAVNSAQQAGLPQGSYLATDWEQDVNNNTNGSVAANTNAITSFMDTVHDGGYNRSEERRVGKEGNEERSTVAPR